MDIDFSLFEKAVGRPMSLLKMFPIQNGFFKYMDLYVEGVEAKNFLTISDGPENETLYLCKKEAADLYKKVGLLSCDKFQSDSFVSKTYSYSDALAEKSKEMASKDFARMNNEKLFREFSSYVEANEKHAPCVLMGFHLDAFLTKKLGKILESKENYNPETVNILCSSEKIIPAIAMKKEILKAALEDNPNLDKLMGYSWLPVYDYCMKPYSRQFYLEQINDEKKENPEVKLNEMERNQRELSQKRKELMAELEFSDEERHIIELAREFVYLRTYRSDVMRQAYYYSIPLMKEIAGRLDINLNELSVLLFTEIRQFLLHNEKPDKEIMKKRLKSFLYVFNEGRAIVTTDEKEIIEAKTRLERNQGHTINGMPAFPGVVVGKVRMILVASDVIKMEKGEILVAKYTTPDYIFAFDKAVAVVTDEGGITSHAAVVAREMKLPTVVGTGNATTVLNDGDKIRVDATKGIVTKL